MSQFGNRLPTIMQAGPAVPDFSSANNISQIGEVLSDVFKIAGQAKQNSLAEKRRGLENQAIANRLKVGEQEVEQARIGVQLNDQRSETAKLQLDTEQQHYLYDKLVKAEQLGVVTKQAQMSPEEWSAYVAQHPIVDHKLADEVGTAMGNTWAQADTTAMLRDIADAAVKGENPSVQGLVDKRFAQRAGDFAVAHPAAVNAYKTKVLESAIGYVDSAQKNATTAYQNRISGSVDSEIASLVGRTYIGEVKPDEMLARASQQALLIPGMRRPDGSLDQRNFEAYMATKIQGYASGNVIKNPSADLAPMKSMIDAMPKRIQESLQGFGIQGEIDNTQKQREVTAAAKSLKQFTTRAADIQRADDIPSMKVLRDNAAATLTGETRTTGLLDLDSRIIKMQKTLDGANQVVDILAGRQAMSSEIRPSGEALNKGWARASAFMPPDQAVAAFVSKGLEVPSDAIQLAKDSIATGKPMQAVTMVSAAAQVSRDKGLLLADKIDPKGLLATSITMTVDAGITPDSPEYGTILTTLSNPASEVHLQTAKTILKDKKNFSSIDQIQQYLNLNEPPLVGDNVLNAFSDRFAFRFTEAMNSGIDQTTATARAAQMASRETTANLVPVQSPTGEGWLGGNDHQTVLVDKKLFGDVVESRSFSSYGLMTPSVKLTNSLDDAFDALGNTPMRPDVAFRSNGKVYVPGIDNDGNVTGFMEWDAGAGQSTRVISKSKNADEFTTIDQVFEPGPTASPFYLMRNRPEYGVGTLQQYDAKYPGSNRGAQIWMVAADRVMKQNGRRINLSNPVDVAAVRSSFDVLANNLGYSTEAAAAPNDNAPPK